MSGNGGLRTLLNPQGVDHEAGPAFLTRCFTTRWTHAMYRWHLQRSFGGEPPDRLVLMDGRRAAAGCGLVYRRLRMPDGELHRVSIVVAACTLPDVRECGFYARVLEAARERSAARGCAALLGFVTAENASRRGLARLGGVAVPASYLVSGDRFAEAATLRIRRARVADDWPERAAARLQAAPARARFDYPDVGAWRSQMVDRPHATQAVRIGATCRALIEAVGDTDRLQWLDGEPRERVAAIRAVAARAARAGRKFFMYSTCPQEVAAACRIGLTVRPGYMMAVAVREIHASSVCAWPGMSW